MENSDDLIKEAIDIGGFRLSLMENNDELIGEAINMSGMPIIYQCN
jgi:hypothetical protein